MVEHVTKYHFLANIIVFNIFIVFIFVVGIMAGRDFIFGGEEE